MVRKKTALSACMIAGSQSLGQRAPNNLSHITTPTQTEITTHLADQTTKVLRTTPPEGTEVRDLSDWKQIFSKPVTVNGQSFTIVGFHDGGNRIIVGEPPEYNDLITGNTRVENMQAVSDWGGNNMSNRFTHDNLSGYHTGRLYDISDYNGSGESVLVLYLAGNQNIAFSIDNQTIPQTDITADGGYAYADDPWTFPESCIASQGQDPCYDYTQTLSVSEDPNDGDTLMHIQDIQTSVADQLGRTITYVYKQPGVYQGVARSWVYDNSVSGTATTDATYTNAELSSLSDGTAVYAGIPGDLNRIQVILNTETEPTDTDGDGVADTEDNCPDNYNPDQADQDNDGIGDVCDDDRDGDGIPNDQDCDPDNPNITTGEVYYRDSDGDGYGNANQTTTACSQPTGYVSNSSDCDDTDATIHPGATEIAGDGIDQDCDGEDLPLTDTDGDGVPDAEDNCPDISNTDQADQDNDGIGDVCDDIDNNDDDGDGVINEDDQCPNTPPNTPVDADGCELQEGEINYTINRKSPISCDDGEGYSFTEEEGCEEQPGFLQFTASDPDANGLTRQLLDDQENMIEEATFENEIIKFPIESVGSYIIQTDKGTQQTIEIHNE